METCRTPKIVRTCVEFARSPLAVGIESTPGFVKNSCNIRCYTPILSDVVTPKLSPIFGALKKSAAALYPSTTSTSPGLFMASPTTPLSKNFRFKEPSSDHLRLTPKQQQQRQRQPDFTEEESKLEPKLDKSDLDHSLNVTMLLKTIGLENYSNVFEKQGIFLDEFLKIKRDDLQNIGLQSDELCNAIIELVRDFNKN